MIHHQAGGGASVAAHALDAGRERHGWDITWLPDSPDPEPEDLLSDLEAGAFDLVHLHCWYRDLPLSLWRRLARRWPTVCTLHDVWVVNQFGEECWECGRDATCLGCPALPPLKRWRPNIRVRNRWAKARAFHRHPPHAVIYPSAWMQRRVARSEWRRFPGKIIPYALDATPWQGPRPDPAGGGRPAASRVLFAGNMYSSRDHRKGLPDLLAAWPRVLAEVPGAHLLIAGRLAPPWNTARPGVTVLGDCAREDLPELMRSVDVFCLPSRGDNSPLAVLEAMAAGTPVLATAVGGIPEQIGDEAGWLVPAASPEPLARGLVDLLNDSSSRARMAKAGPRRVRDHFAPETSIDAHHDLYRQVRTTRP